MADALHADPTFDAAVRMEVREKRCGVCINRHEVLKGAFLCRNNKRFPACKGDEKGFSYDVGEC